MLDGFDGGKLTSEAGGLLREVEEQFKIPRSFADAFTDHRSPDAVEFTVVELQRQRVMGIALGFEDLNHHEKLRHDPVPVLMVGHDDITGWAKNKRLTKATDGKLEQFQQTGHAARAFKNVRIRTKKSWSRERCVIGKAEYLSA